MRGVITDDHSSNVAAFNSLISLYGPNIHGVKFASNFNFITYLFFDTVHLLKNLRNNLLNYKRFIFPKFKFHDFFDSIIVPAGEISWKLFHNVYDQDQRLQSHLHQAPKLTYRALHPGNNKQNVKLALAIFDPTTTAAMQYYNPEQEAAAGFLTLIFKWRTVCNSKHKV